MVGCTKDQTYTPGEDLTGEQIYIDNSTSEFYVQTADEKKELAEELNLKLTICCGEFSENKARKITFQHAREYDIIMCASDMMAIGAMKALIDMDIYRPVCGFDGINLMGYAGKQMHTVRQDFKQLAAGAIDEMARLMDGHEGREVIMPHQLIRIKYEDVIM